MGLFNFFQKNKSSKSALNNLPPVVKEAFNVLFPNGASDHSRQVNELYNHFNQRIPAQILDNNLIFILTGYLITGDSKSKETTIEKVLSRKDSKLSKADAEYIYEYALRNHPKLSSLLLLDAFEELVDKGDGCDTDTMPGGTGIFGYSTSNPIPVKGISGIYEYLSRLRDEKYDKVNYTRLGSIFNEISPNPIEGFQIISANGENKLYFSAYERHTSNLSPSGYILVDNKNVVISTGGCNCQIGSILSSRTAEAPRMIGLNSFGVSSEDELIGAPASYVEAEKLNKKAVVLYNAGDIEKALIALDNAISLGSLNAVNTKFAILHSEERYSEALEYLKGLVDTKHATKTSLYNLAVIYYNGNDDTNFNVTTDICHSREILLKAKSLTNDERDTFGKSAEKYIDKLIAQIETI